MFEEIEVHEEQNTDFNDFIIKRLNFKEAQENYSEEQINQLKILFKIP